jgi:hypothetical protein
MLNDVSDVPFDKIYYYISDIHNFVDLDDRAYDARLRKSNILITEKQKNFFFTFNFEKLLQLYGHKLH